MLDDWYKDYMAKPPPTPTAVTPAAATTQWQPGSDATVQGQLTSVLDKGGPLMERAAARSNQQMNARGLLNSSMAIGAGQGALYDAALPIARDDAATFGAAGKFNAGEANTSARQATDFTGRANLQAADFAQQNVTQGRELASRAGLQASQQAAESARQATDFTGRANLQQADMAHQDITQGRELVSRAGLQASQQAADTGLQRERLAQQTSERLGGEAATTARDTAQFGNRLQEIQAQTASAIQVYDAQNGTKLFDNYRDTSQQTYDSYVSAVQAIQISDMNPDVKAAHIANLQQLFTTRQEFINTMFAETPVWAKQWSQFEMQFGAPAAPPP